MQWNRYSYCGVFPSSHFFSSKNALILDPVDIVNILLSIMLLLWSFWMKALFASLRPLCILSCWGQHTISGVDTDLESDKLV